MAAKQSRALMQYQSFDPSGCGFPKPLVPMLPSLSLRSLRLRRQASAHTLATSARARLYSRGRYAMTDAYRLCGVGPEAPLLAPAYHCRTMLDPAIRLGADILTYPLTPDLHPDLQGLADCLARCPQQPAALLVTHYFGFPQPLTELLAFCNANGITLIEDCSHCLFLPTQSNRLGRQGRYCVSSPYKFFPIDDGGVLWAKEGAPLPDQPPTSPGLPQELKGLARVMQRALRATHLPSAGHMQVLTAADPTPPLGNDRLQSSESPSVHYRPDAEHVRMLGVSLWTLCHTDTQRLITRRRSLYGTWLHAVADLPHCRPVFPDLPDDCVPYVFALHIAQPDVHFHALKRVGVPIGRWDDMAVSDCALAMEYRTHVLHLPCHQELSDEQMRWMTETVVSVFANNDTGGAS